MPYTTETIERMVEIKDEIKSLVNEAMELLERDTMIYNRATSYWFPHILMELDEEHNWIGGSMCSLQNTIDEMNEDSTDSEEYDLVEDENGQIVEEK